MSPEPERLAWSVLRTANRTQAKGSTARIVVPRDTEMVDGLGRERGVIPTDDDLLSAEEVQSLLRSRGGVAISAAQREGLASLLAKADTTLFAEGASENMGLV